MSIHDTFLGAIAELPMKAHRPKSKYRQSDDQYGEGSVWRDKALLRHR
jgi:hypothetical protein